MNQILQIARLLRPYWRYVGQSLLVGIMAVFLGLPGPYITKLLIDHVYPNEDFSLLYFVLLSGTVMGVFSALTGTLSGFFGQHVGTRISFDFQTRFYRHIQGLDFSFFDQRETGEVLARFEDMQASISSTIGMFNTLIMNCLQLLIFPAILFYIDWRLALISVAVLPFDALLVAASRKYFSRFSERIAQARAELSARAYESLASIRTVQALGLEERFYERLCTLFARVAKLEIKASLLQGSTGFLATLLKVGGTLAYGWYGWTQVLQGNLSVGTYMAFSGYVGYLYGPIGNLIGLLQGLEITLVHSRRFFEIYHLQPEIRDRAALPTLGKVRGHLAFRGVDFSYGQVNVLQRIDLEIPARSTLALVGRSGSGKSTLVQLIPRFYDPDAGCIAMDGGDIRQFRLGSVRRQVGFAMQGSSLFRGSILDNLTFGGDIPVRDVEDAARAAHIHDFVAALPQGYLTPIGEQGADLSEGQKQRLALARVLLLDAPILVLDEPTAALDTEAEFCVQQALQRIGQERTVIIVAHRLATIRSADEIAVLDEGRIVARGSHDTLMSEEGLYASLQQGFG